MGATTWADEHLDCNCKQRDPLHSYADGTTQEIGTHEAHFSGLRFRFVPEQHSRNLRARAAKNPRTTADAGKKMRMQQQERNE